jgi:hypothetical protein
MTVLNIPKTLRAAAVTVALAGTAFAAMPVQANHLDADFSVRFGTPGFSFRFGDDDFDRCMTNRQVRRDLRADGYRDIQFLDRRGRIVHLVAELQRPGRDREYRIAYDSCRGVIVDRDRIG